MCGITGAFKTTKGYSKILKSLEKLEYRGYDSVGVAAYSDQGLKFAKDKGVEREVIPEELDSRTAVGHTRWATHGKPTRENAHPHTDCGGDFAVVHNGIITNHNELRKGLKEHSFSSETDTEVIPHLLEEKTDQGLSFNKAVKEIHNILKGSYALAILNSDGKMALVRQKSSLIISSTENGYLFSSDPNVIDSKWFVPLKNGEVVFLHREPVFDSERRIETEGFSVSIKDNEHYMEKEIYQQPSALRKVSETPEDKLYKVREKIQKAEKVVFTGCGTSGNAASTGVTYLQRKGVNCQFIPPQRLENRSNLLDEDDLVIALSQSGETEDVLSAIRGLETEIVSLVNIRGSSITRLSDHNLFIRAGPEIGVAATKTFVNQLGMLNLLKSTFENSLEEEKDKLRSTADKVEDYLKKPDILNHLEDKIVSKDDVYFIARGNMVETAFESALKLKELSYIHAEGFSGSEFKHGTLALIEEGVPVIAISSPSTLTELNSNCSEVESRGASVKRVGASGSADIQVPETAHPEIASVVPMQLLALKVSKLKGHNPDKPRNLAKSVTVK